MKHEIFILMSLILFSGCSTTYISKKVADDKVKHVMYHKNIFSDKAFDTLTVKVDDIRVNAEKYESSINPEVVEASGEAVGTTAGVALRTAAIGG